MSATITPPLSVYERQLEHHAILCTTGFLILLPIGALLSRYARTFTNRWWWGHAAIQLLISGPVIVTGWVLAFKFTALGFTGGHFIDPHKRIGLALLVLYILTVFGGLFVKFVKFPALFRHRRPPQNYAHAVLGLGIIALAGYQVWYGIMFEWAEATGNVHRVPHAAFNAWVALIIVFWTLYALGLALLPRQFRQERAAQVGQEKLDSQGNRSANGRSA